MNNTRLLFIADDDEDYLFQLKYFFENKGFLVETASLQSEAEERIREIIPDIAILDLMMENDDSGFILARLIKQLHPNIPVIIATAVANETGISFSDENKGASLWIQADMYLEKGIRLEQLYSEVLNLLKKENEKN